MIRPQFRLSLDEEVIVDNFAGGGGASTGIELALGRHVDFAVNHDRFALGMHRINHPQTVHYCEDIFDIDPEEVCEGRRVGLCHNSPDCKHFSKAKGGMPLDKRIRGLVLIMLKWAKYGARVLTMENVEEIVTWGPLIRMKKNGKWGWYPDPKHKGRTWQAFLSILSTGIDPDHPDLPEILDVLASYITKAEAVRGFGYTYDARVIRACDHGTPTIRKRLFMIARRDGRPIVWPEPTHAPRDDRHRNGKKLQAYRTIAECIDWTIPCPSIFLDREAARRVRCKRPLAKSTLRRIAKGVDRYVLKADEPFLVSVTHQGGDRIEAVSEPGRTVTGAHRGEKALVMPILTEHANREGRNFSAEEPLRTQCAEVKGGHFAMIAGSVVQTGYGEREGQEPRTIDPNGPGTTAVAGGCKQAAVAATLVHTAHGDEDKKGKKRGRGAHDLSEPMPSALATSDCAIAAASMVKLRGDAETHSPGSPVTDPGHTISAGGTHHGLVAAHLTKFCTGSVGQSLDEPGPTITAGSHSEETHGGAATANGLVAAYLAQHNGGEVGHQTVGHDARDPFSTISAKGSQQQIVAAHLQKYYGTEQDPRLDEPSHTVTTKHRFGLIESIIACGLTEEQLAGALRVARFLRDHGVEFDGAFAMVRGFVIVDLGMRMLIPRELFRAQGFSESYVIDRAWLVDPATGSVEEVKLTKEQQIRMCGNSVCPDVMKALVTANVPELSAWEPGERKRSKRKEVAA
jgi:DNA (cytosine-5)-methyltransferase 1